MRNRLVMAFAAIAVCLTAPASAQAQTVKDFITQVYAYWTAPNEPFRIIGNVYDVGTKGLKSYLITSPEGHVLIDTAMPHATSPCSRAGHIPGRKVRRSCGFPPSKSIARSRTAMS